MACEAESILFPSQQNRDVLIEKGVPLPWNLSFFFNTLDPGLSQHAQIIHLFIHLSIHWHILPSYIEILPCTEDHTSLWGHCNPGEHVWEDGRNLTYGETRHRPLFSIQLPLPNWSRSKLLFSRRKRLELGKLQALEEIFVWSVFFSPNLPRVK